MPKRNENLWTREFLAPLLRRLGFRKVELTHGTLEAGRDLVFAEYDKFGLLRYYAAQVKDGDIRSKAETRELRTIISQVQDAYETKYKDIATGTEHKISGVYLIANGGITEAAKKILFDKTGSWLHILDQSQLQIAESSHFRLTEQDRRGRYLALKLELACNRTSLEERLPQLQNILSGQTKSLNIGGSLLRDRSLQRVFDIAVMELHSDDLNYIHTFLWLTETINFVMLKIPIGAVDVSAFQQILVGLTAKISDYLKHVEYIDKLVDYVLESDEPVPGKRLEKLQASDAGN